MATGKTEDSCAYLELGHQHSLPEPWPSMKALHRIGLDMRSRRGRRTQNPNYTICPLRHRALVLPQNPSYTEGRASPHPWQLSQPLFFMLY
ncbi:hypothetical protein SUGI_1179550 [Cryptomeria japonica]|nr:hypothetical protein SUGI_1179550 [Cryptomeria japonica]